MLENFRPWGFTSKHVHGFTRGHFFFTASSTLMTRLARFDPWFSCCEADGRLLEDEAKYKRHNFHSQCYKLFHLKALNELYVKNFHIKNLWKQLYLSDIIPNVSIDVWTQRKLTLLFHLWPQLSFNPDDHCYEWTQKRRRCYSCSPWVSSSLWVSKEEKKKVLSHLFLVINKSNEKAVLCLWVLCAFSLTLLIAQDVNL